MKILIAEDDSTSRRTLEAALSKWGYDVVTAADGNEAWEKLQGTVAPKLAVLDWIMPGLEGIEICRRLRDKKADNEQYTYLILLTSKGTKDNIVSGMAAGADDYIVKPFDPHELRVRIRAGKRIIELQSELLMAKQDLFLQSRTDSLTGVLNRRAIFSQVETELSRVRRENKKISLSMLDIDFFKKVNDTYGHMAGDEVLRDVVKRINNVIRIYDSLGTLGRYGGEEFLLIIPGTKEEDAYGIFERIRTAIVETDFPVNGSNIQVTVSQGVVTWDGHEKADDLIARADKALYQAKENGRNRVEQISSNRKALHIVR
ncbi:MAG: diguanylate cyclase [Gammaproteobacteria bacterium]